MKALLLATLWALPAIAQPMDLYGFNPRAVAMAGVQAASDGNFTASYYNPALLRGGEVGLGFLDPGLLHLITQLIALGGKADDLRLGLTLALLGLAHQAGGSAGRKKDALRCSVVRQRGATSLASDINSWVSAKTSHRRTVPSLDPVTTRWPSGHVLRRVPQPTIPTDR